MKRQKKEGAGRGHRVRSRPLQSNACSVITAVRASERSRNAGISASRGGQPQGPAWRRCARHEPQRRLARQPRVWRRSFHTTCRVRSMRYKWITQACEPSHAWEGAAPSSWRAADHGCHAGPVRSDGACARHYWMS